MQLNKKKTWNQSNTIKCSPFFVNIFWEWILPALSQHNFANPNNTNDRLDIAIYNFYLYFLFTDLSIQTVYNLSALEVYAIGDRCVSERMFSILDKTLFTILHNNQSKPFCYF